MRMAMVTVEQEFYRQAKNQVLAHTMESLRRHLLGAVASEFSREVAYNTAQYVRSIGSSSVVVEVEGNAGEVLEQKFKDSVSNLKTWIESQPPDSPIIRKLLEVYGPEKKGVSSYVKRAPQPVWQTLKVTPRSEPWLNRTKEPVDISDMISLYAERIFDQTFGDGPLSSKTIPQP